MLMAWRFEPSRFFLKGKVTQKQTSYKHKHTLREEVSQVLKKCFGIIYLNVVYRFLITRNRNWANILKLIWFCDGNGNKSPLLICFNLWVNVNTN